VDTAFSNFFEFFVFVFFGTSAGVAASPSEAEVEIEDASDDDSSEAEVVELVLFDSQLREPSVSGFSSSKIFCCSWDRLKTCQHAPFQPLGAHIDCTLPRLRRPS
jgi:hypothetical protein